MYDAIITLFNFHEKTGAWHTTVFSGVSLYATEGAGATRDSGRINESTIDAIIHVDRNQAASTVIYEPNRIADSAGNTICADDGTALCYKEPDTCRVKRYIGAKAFSKLDDPGGYFTFKPETDFFAVGNYSSSTPILDDTYEQGLYHAMNDAQDDVFMIVSAAFYGLLPHFEIGGR